METTFTYEDDDDVLQDYHKSRFFELPENKPNPYEYFKSFYDYMTFCARPYLPDIKKEDKDLVQYFRSLTVQPDEFDAVFSKTYQQKNEPMTECDRLFQALKDCDSFHQVKQEVLDKIRSDARLFYHLVDSYSYFKIVEDVALNVGFPTHGVVDYQASMVVSSQIRKFVQEHPDYGNGRWDNFVKFIRLYWMNIERSIDDE